MDADHPAQGVKVARRNTFKIRDRGPDFEFSSIQQKLNRKAYQPLKKRKMDEVQALSKEANPHAISIRIKPRSRAQAMRSYSVDSELTFEVVERPRLGACRILSDVEDRTGLLHLASSRQDAEVWLTEHHYQSARLEDVTADELAADIVEGRAAA